MLNSLKTGKWSIRVITVLAIIALAILSVLATSIQPSIAQGATFRNPLNQSHGSDPWMLYHNGNYYLAATTWSSSSSPGITMKRASTINGLIAATPQSVWTDTTPSRCCNIWAPEFHLLSGPNGTRWYMYYVAGTSACCSNQFIHVLESAGTDPMGPYTYRGRLFDPANDNWGVDPTVLQLNGQLYLLWSGYQGALFNSNQVIFIAPMSNPWTLSGGRSLLSVPTFNWERFTAPVNEGPEILKRGSITYLIFSASWCGTTEYKLGLSTYNGGPVTSQSSWVKSANPVFQQSPANGVYGPAHNGFFKSPDGTEDWIVYHANNSPSGGCDTGRTTRIQKFTWNANNTPNFGVPLPLSANIPVPSGEGGTTSTPTPVTPPTFQPPTNTPVPGTGPIGWWKLDNNLNDSSGNGRNGTGSGSPTFTTGKFNQAINLNGTSQFVTAPNSVNTTGSFSVSAWVRLTSLTGYRTIASQDGNTISGFYLQYHQAAGNKFAFAMKASDSDSSTLTEALSTSSPATNTWYHVVGVRNKANNTILLYVNGVLQQTLAYSAAWNATGSTIIGAAKFSGNRVDRLQGQIDSVRIYNRALTAAEVTTLFNATSD
jgi:GH43 family beta-xylosidase